MQKISVSSTPRLHEGVFVTHSPNSVLLSWYMSWYAYYKTESIPIMPYLAFSLAAWLVFGLFG